MKAGGCSASAIAALFVKTYPNLMVPVASFALPLMEEVIAIDGTSKRSVSAP